MIDGRMRKVVAQPTKQGWLYVFDRATGVPIWPIEERAVERPTCLASRRIRHSPS